MKYLRFRVCIQVVLLTTTVTLSQVLAEESPQQKLNNTQDNGGNWYVGQGILQVLPTSAGAVKAAFPNDRDRTGEKVSSPGRTYGALTAILIAAGGAAALSYMLTRGGDNKHATPATPAPPAPVTTSVTPGTPVIIAPPGH
jgi:hypothetical protein